MKDIEEYSARSNEMDGLLVTEEMLIANTTPEDPEAAPEEEAGEG